LPPQNALGHWRKHGCGPPFRRSNCHRTSIQHRINGWSSLHLPVAPVPRSGRGQRRLQAPGQGCLAQTAAALVLTALAALARQRPLSCTPTHHLLQIRPHHDAGQALLRMAMRPTPLLWQVFRFLRTPPSWTGVMLCTLLPSATAARPTPGLPFPHVVMLPARTRWHVQHSATCYLSILGGSCKS
jgi:hypothetical protein